MVIWENVLVEGNFVVSVVIQVIGKYGVGNVYEVSRVGWLMVRCIDVLQRNNESLKVVYKQLMVKCEIQRDFVVVDKKVFAYLREE